MVSYVTVDVFTDAPFEGNPVAVYFDADDLGAEDMQRIAREMNLSETTFVLRPRAAGADARVRIFTPVNELPFAGHPLLGTAIALARERTDPTLRLETERAVVPFEIDRSGSAVSAVMAQPLPSWEVFDRADELLAALGVGGSLLPVTMYVNGPRHVLVTLTLDELTALSPDHRALEAFPDMAANVVAAEGDHWRLRMFSPAYGVVEDAATGSVAGPVATHLARFGWAEFGDRVEVVQGVEIGRPSYMYAVAHGTPERLEEILVEGASVVMGRGELTAGGALDGAGPAVRGAA